MVDKLVASLERPISSVRLETYRNGGSDLDMLVNYFFNVELSEALYPTLQAFEIALRNSIHLALSNHFSNDNWFANPTLYPPAKHPARFPWQIDSINAAKVKLQQSGKSIDANRLVAELHFGFWHGLFNRPFKSTLWRPNQSHLLTQVFPDAPKRFRNRQDVWNRINQIRILRNRVMHYEPIWNRTRLESDHSRVLEALGWISPEMQETIAMCDRFAQVARSRHETATRVIREAERVERDQVGR